MRTNAILTYPKHKERLYCYEEFGKLLFYRNMNDLPCFVSDLKITKYYTDASHISFKEWQLVLLSKPYFDQLDPSDVPIQIKVPLTLTKFTRVFEPKGE